MDIFKGDIFKIKVGGGKVGSEQRGERYGVIISNDTGNKFAPTVIVALITSKDKDINRAKDLPTHVRFYLKQHSIILTEQILTIDKSRLKKYIACVDQSTLHKIDEALKISMGL